nr:amidohydrolase [Evansella caseinilytica]
MGTLWYGGKIRTLISETDVQEAVFVNDGYILGVGEKRKLEAKFKGQITTYENLRGAVMYPGFVDSHLHMIGHGEKLLRLDLSEVTSVSELMEVLQRRLEELPKGSWLTGEGFNENLFPDKLVPNRHILDEVTTEYPVMLTRVCRHACVANSYALQLAGVDETVSNPPGGIIEKDSFGKPTGYLLDHAQDLIRAVMPESSFSDVEKALDISIHDMFKNGFVGGHTEDLNYYGDPLQTLACFYKLIDGRRIKFRANLLIHHEAFPQIIGRGKADENHAFIERGAIKIFADGALGGRTALLSEPYADDPSTNGVQIHKRESLEQIVKRARADGFPVAVHAIGDLALEQIIDVIEAFPPSNGKRDRLIHMQVARKDLLERLQKLPVVLDIQPRFVASDFPWVEERLGTERLTYSFAWKKLLAAGLRCAGGSDAPIEPVSPLLGIHAAVTRRKPEENHQGYQPEEKLTLFEALRLFTYGSAEAICKENERGLIAEGYVADFTVLEKDLFELEPDEWLGVAVEKTIVDNTTMYDRCLQ